ncbi:MAG: hypothetical protein OEM64_14585 [Gammaproteobacteria bacterium]|nr:hypothetical protein [Gammaproteobacteria bacterium]
MRILPILLLSCSLALMPAASRASDLEQSMHGSGAEWDSYADTRLRVAQGGGKSLSEAVEQVRRQTNGRILSARTKVNGNREVHHIKVLTKDGKVKTVKVQGRKRD